MYQHQDFDPSRGTYRMRSSDRMRCNIGAVLVNGAQEYEATILDCSSHGLLIWCLNDLAAAMQIDIGMPEIGSRPARVIWYKDHFAGIEFAVGLRPSELLTLRRHSTLVQTKPKQKPVGARSVGKRVSTFIPRCTFLR
jgi:hypothetical protein